MCAWLQLVKGPKAVKCVTRLSSQGLAGVGCFKPCKVKTSLIRHTLAPCFDKGGTSPSTVGSAPEARRTATSSSLPCKHARTNGVQSMALAAHTFFVWFLLNLVWNVVSIRSLSPHP